MTRPIIIDKKVAEEFLKTGQKNLIASATAITDEAAEILSKHEKALYLNGLTALSDAAAQSLSKHTGDICGRPAEEWVKSLRKD